MICTVFLSLAIASIAEAQNFFFNETDPNDNPVPYPSPGGASALPLAVRSPYTSTWISTVNNGTLNSNGAIFWTGDPIGWEGLITVDGTTYEYLGTSMSSLPRLKNLTKAKPYSVSYDSQYSNFSLDAGPVRITAKFLSPVLPKDLCRTSIPLSYFEASFESIDGTPHDVQLYSDVNARWVTNDDNTLNWTLSRNSVSINGTGNVTDAEDTLYNWLVWDQSPYPLGENSDHPRWGNLTYATSPSGAKNFSFQSGHSTDIRYHYVFDHTLQNSVDASYRSASDREPVFAFSHDFGSSTSGSVLYTVGAVQDPIIQYLTSAGLTKLQPWWTQCYDNLADMIQTHYDEYDTAQREAARWDTQLRADIASYYSVDSTTIVTNSTSGTSPPWANFTADAYINGTDQFGNPYIFDPETAYGFLSPNGTTGIAVPDVSEADSYYQIVALSARQVQGATVLTVDPKSDDQPLLFLKEISSDGNVQTVDVIFPSIPYFLYANPELLQKLLEPLFDIQEGGFYPNGYSIHDLGSSFPNATGHVEGLDEAMPVEECGNMILMTYAYYKFSSDASYLTKHYATLKKFASYLIEFSLLPGHQLSTDDFAGQLANQTNLAIKGIVALNAMSHIAAIASTNASDSASYLNISTSYFNHWEHYGIDPSSTHTLLSYQHRSSWGLLYNIYPALLLDLDIIPESVFRLQSDFYPLVSQVFGVPLDSRHHYTKSDWQLWAAASSYPSTRRLFVNAVAYWLNNTSTDLPFTDWYETVGTGGYPEGGGQFLARPVVGGHFSLLALWKAGRDKVLVNGGGGGQGLGNGSVPLPGSNATWSFTRVPSQTVEQGILHTGESIVLGTTTSVAVIVTTAVGVAVPTV